MKSNAAIRAKGWTAPALPSGSDTGPPDCQHHSLLFCGCPAGCPRRSLAAGRLAAAPCAARLPSTALCMFSSAAQARKPSLCKVQLQESMLYWLQPAFARGPVILSDIWSLQWVSGADGSAQKEMRLEAPHPNMSGQDGQTSRCTL